MADKSPDRMVYLRGNMTPRCISASALALIPEELEEPLFAPVNDLQLAVDCIPVFGGVPLPVAHAILRNLEPARAAIHMAIAAREDAAEGLVH